MISLTAIYVGDTQIQINVFLALIKVKLQTMEKATGINWEIQNTTCVSEINMQLSGNREYQTECTLVIGQSYILECISNDGGWNSNHLIIENVAYCEYAKAKTIINIIFNGNVNNLCTFLISSKSDIRF